VYQRDRNAHRGVDGLLSSRGCDLLSSILVDRFLFIDGYRRLGLAHIDYIKLPEAAGRCQRDQARCTNVIGTLIAAWMGSCLLVAAICFPRYSSIDFYLSTDIDGWA